jgi:hypothetical protein
MKKQVLFQGLAALMLMALITTACTKEEDPPEDLQKLSFDSEAVLDMVPDGLKNSDDEYAQSCYSYIESAVDMSQFIDNMEVPDNAQKSQSKATGAETWQWTWNYGGESFTFYWSYEESGGKRLWTMDIQYGSGPRYSYIDAWEYTDGTGGEVTYNFGWAAAMDGEPIGDDEFLYWKYTWSLDSSGAYHLDFKWDADDAEYDYYILYETVINADGSGTVDYFMAGALFYHMEWDVLGNGAWVYYIDGAEFMSGLWTV